MSITFTYSTSDSLLACLAQNVEFHYWKFLFQITSQWIATGGIVHRTKTGGRAAQEINSKTYFPEVFVRSPLKEHNKCVDRVRISVG